MTEVTALPSIVAENCEAVPAVVPVKLTEYVPSALSATPPNVPEDVPPENPKTTVKPPEVILFPAASRARRTTWTLFPAVSVDGLPVTVTIDCANDTTPGVTVTEGSVVVTGRVFIVAPMLVGVPEVTPVKMAV
jgi:hypothetical protein